VILMDDALNGVRFSDIISFFTQLQPVRIHNDGNLNTFRKVAGLSPFKDSRVIPRAFICFWEGELTYEISASSSAFLLIARQKEFFDESKIYIIHPEPRIAFIILVQKFFDSLVKRKSFQGADCVNNECPPSISIGDNSVLSPGVIVYERSLMGGNCIVHAGSVLGADGFHFHESKLYNKVFKFPSLSYLKVKDSVEIGANTTIDCGTLSDTFIGSSVKIDNLVHVGHSTRIGEGTRIGPGAIIAGNVEIGRNVWVGPNATLSNNVKIGDYARITLGSTVINNVKSYQTVSGHFAYPHSEYLTAHLRMRKGISPKNH